MPPDSFVPGSPADWIRYAKADLALARVPLPADGLYELLCFHAQQAAEKKCRVVAREQDAAVEEDADLVRVAEIELLGLGAGRVDHRLGQHGRLLDALGKGEPRWVT